MSHIFYIFATSLLFAVLSTPVVKFVAIRAGVVDKPNHRKIHKAPIPLLGGVAIYLSVCFALLIFGEAKYLVQLINVFIGATAISFFGLWDDRYELNVSIKLMAQVAAAVLLIGSGIVVQLPIPYFLNVIITLFWVVGITNAMNLLDNMDGLSSGVGAVASFFFLILALFNGQFLVAGLAAAMLGACLGFLVHNFNPAKIFMGDTGSLFIGFILAVLGIKMRFPATVSWVSWLIPVLVLGIPIFDTTLVFISRLRRGKNPLTTPGKDHLSHRLVSLGLTHKTAVLTIYFGGILLGSLALWIGFVNLNMTLKVGSGLGITASALLYGFERSYSVKG